MNQDPFTLLIIEGFPASDNPVLEFVRKVRQTNVLDNIQKSADVPQIGRRLLYTTDTELASSANKAGVEAQLYPQDREFHFGNFLAEIIRHHKLSNVFYLGGGAAPLLPRREFKRIVKSLEMREAALVTNNLFSSDFVAFTSANNLLSVPLPSSDNGLAMALRDGCGMEIIPLPPSAHTLMDIDTPTDIQILSLHPDISPRTREEIEKYEVTPGKPKLIQQMLTMREAEIFLYGRVGSHLFSYLDHGTLCRFRIFSEERSMKSRGRVERNEVFSFLASSMQDIGLQKFMERLGQFCHAAILDTRVLFAHLRKTVSSSDRYCSDMGLWDRIEDPDVSALTQAAAAAPVPVIMGGHSLVSGGLWTLVDAFWRSADGMKYLEEHPHALKF
jgi:hypothetical protein